MTKEFKPPKSLAVCADLLYTTREERLTLQKEVDVLVAKESALREHLINNLPKSDASGIAGKLARASVELKTTIKVADWDKLYAYVIKNAKKGSFALLQRRVSDGAVREIWEQGKEVPGCEPYKVPVISITKR